MEQSEIIEGNRLIAEFLNWDRHGDSQMFEVPNLYPIYPKGHEAQTGWIADYPENMQFHNSWDWLMPVVFKIRHDRDIIIFLPKNGIEKSATPFIEASGKVIRTLPKIDIYLTYRAGVEFIKWYNSHLPTYVYLEIKRGNKKLILTGSSLEDCRIKKSKYYPSWEEVTTF